MMSFDEKYRGVTRWDPWSPALDARREQVLNLLCELREDPQFAEWCRLTSALRLSHLPLDQLAALHAGATETIFPEVGEWGQLFGDTLNVPAARAADTVLADRSRFDRHAAGYADGPVTRSDGAFVPPIEQGDRAMVTHPTETPHNTERAG